MATLTYKESINQAVELLEQRDSINEQLKALKDAITEAGLDAKAVIATATAIKNDKLDALEEYADNVTEVIEAFRK